MEAAVSTPFERALEVIDQLPPADQVALLEIVRARRLGQDTFQGMRESRASYGEELKMRTLVLEMPEGVADALRVPPTEQEVRLRQELAIRLYQKALLSFGKARELAGINKWAFHVLLGNEGVTRSYDLEELRQDLATLERLP
jgi:predicted HTH domain antitoxin